MITSSDTDRAPVMPGNEDWSSRRRIRLLVLLAATTLGLYLCYQLAVPFLPPLVWALVLAVLFTPCQRWLETRLPAGIAAAVSVLLIGAIVVAPAALIGQQLLAQAADGAVIIQAKVASGEWRAAIEARSRSAPFVARFLQDIDVTGAIQSFAGLLSAAAGSIVQGSVYQVIGFCLTFYLLFYFLRDRDAVLESIRTLSPLSSAEMDRLFSRVADTIHATIYGTLAMAFAQGVLGGLMFWWLGLTAPLFWGLTMAALAVVPVLGAFIVWIPAALYLLSEGSWGKALILTLWGVLVVGMIDNLLGPMLVGNRLKLHTILAFVSVVGGLLVFGSAGLVLGPLILTVTLLLLETWSYSAT